MDERNNMNYNYNGPGNLSFFREISQNFTDIYKDHEIYA